VDYEEAIAGLPATYAEALRLRDKGLTGVHIAELLDVPPESVDPLLRLAEAKLAALWPTSPAEQPGGEGAT
jgi:DNA-directed RNA polymerase specialized sigma24 family protein